MRVPSIWGAATRRREAREERLELERRATQALHLEQLKALHKASDAALQHLLTKAQADRDAYMAALTSLKEVALAQSSAVEQIAAAINGYLRAFQWASPVTGHTHTDQTEWTVELEKFAQTGITPEGFHLDMTPEERLSWYQRLVEDAVPAL